MVWPQCPPSPEAPRERRGLVAAAAILRAAIPGGPWLLRGLRGWGSHSGVAGAQQEFLWYTSYFPGRGGPSHWPPPPGPPPCSETRHLPTSTILLDQHNSPQGRSDPLLPQVETEAPWGKCLFQPGAP